MSSFISSTNLPVLCTKPAPGERSICSLPRALRHIFGPRSSFGAWLLLLLLSTADFWGTGPAITSNNLIYRLQHCFPKAHPFCSLLAFFLQGIFMQPSSCAVPSSTQLKEFLSRIFRVHPFLHCHFVTSSSCFWYQFKDTTNVFHFHSHQKHV